MTALLGLRNKQKKRKPDFAMPDYHKRKELRKRWVKPQGKHAKIRLHKKGHRRMPSQGYRSPAEVRGYSREGLRAVVVSNIEELAKIKDAKQEGALISHVGLKKRVGIIKAAVAKGIVIINIKKPEEYCKRAEDERKEQKSKKSAPKLQAAGKKEKEKPAEKSLDDITDEDKKKKEKQEKDKLLTKREI